MEDDRAPLPRPKLPQRGSRQPPQRNATFLALAGLLSAAIGLAVLITAVLTGFAPAAIVVILLIMGAVAFLFGGHYLIWVIWLDRVHASRGQSTPIEFWKQAHLPPAPPVVPETETEG
jgi:fatty acid desaturase